MTTAATHYEQSNPTEATLFLAFELRGIHLARDTLLPQLLATRA